MADLHAVARWYMGERGLSLRRLAELLSYDPSYLSKALRGLKPCGPKLARDIDNALQARGEIVRAAARSEKRTGSSRSHGLGDRDQCK